MFCPTVVNTNPYYNTRINQKKQNSFLRQNQRQPKCLAFSTKEFFSPWFVSETFRRKCRPLSESAPEVWGQGCLPVQEYKEGVPGDNRLAPQAVRAGAAAA